MPSLAVKPQYEESRQTPIVVPKLSESGQLVKIPKSIHIQWQTQVVQNKFFKQKNN